MEHTTGTPPLTTVQQSVIDTLAAGSTITAAAEAHGIHRITIYRWMKTRKDFAAALHRARAEFFLARRDDLHYLSNRALETLLAILDNPRSSPAVLLRTAMFILQRPQLPKTGWSMPEPAPDPDGSSSTRPSSSRTMTACPASTPQKRKILPKTGPPANRLPPNPRLPRMQPHVTKCYTL